jgi:hypothetical protein
MTLLAVVENQQERLALEIGEQHLQRRLIWRRPYAKRRRVA